MEPSLDREKANRLYKNVVREYRGTTWLQQIVYLIHNGVDIEEARSKPIDQRIPYLEYSPEMVRRVLAMAHPRLVKTHMPYRFLPAQLQEGKGKVLYIARNPKDVLASVYFFMKRAKRYSYRGEMEDYLELFVTDSVSCGPWWKNVASYWQHRDIDNVFYITYEQLQEDLPGSVRRIAEFLNKPLTDAQVDAISRHCSFSSMSQDKSVDYSWDQDMDQDLGKFMRKGIVGDWKNHFSDDMNNIMDEYIAKNLTTKEIQFRYE